MINNYIKCLMIVNKQFDYNVVDYDIHRHLMLINQKSDYVVGMDTHKIINFINTYISLLIRYNIYKGFEYSEEDKDMFEYIFNCELDNNWFYKKSWVKRVDIREYTVMLNELDIKDCKDADKLILKYFSMYGRGKTLVLTYLVDSVDIFNYLTVKYYSILDNINKEVFEFNKWNDILLTCMTVYKAAIRNIDNFLLKYSQNDVDFRKVVELFREQLCKFGGILTMIYNSHGSTYLLKD